MIWVGITPALAAAASGGVPAPPAENLLLWTEALDNAAWTTSAGSVAVTANAAAAPAETITAESLEFSPNARFGQTSSVAATAGAFAFHTYDTVVTWVRASVTGTFDGVAYTFSIYLWGAGFVVQLRLERVGGFLRCSLSDAGDEAIVLAWGAQLEVGGVATPYVPRTT